jgi:hypothetical protein
VPMSDAAIERRDDARLSTLERVFGTGDMVQMIAATKANVNAAIVFAREREFVSEYPVMKNGRQVGVRLWFHHPTWQLLGQSFGVTAYTEGEPKEVKPGVWQAAAVATTIENGQVVGRAVGMAGKTEAGKGSMTEHALSAIAQARAQRNALRSCLGAVLIAAGFEISDPEGPATKEQIAVLHILEREIGWTHEEAHADAGVTSFTKLTRDQAGDVIDRWTAMRDELRGGGAGTPPPSEQTAGNAAPAPEPSDAVSTSLSGVGTEESPATEQTVSFGEGEPDAPEAGDSSPASDEAWKRAPHDMSISAAIKLATKLRAAERIPGPVPKTKAAFTGAQLARISSAWRDGERG